MIKYPKGGQGSDSYELGLRYTLGVDRGSVEGNKNQLDHEIISF